MTILFVCTGNTCRSPMAALLMRHALDKRGRPDIIVESAGLAAHHEPASRNAIAAMAEVDKDYGAKLSLHVSRQATPEILKSADCVAVMNRNHATTAIIMGADPLKVHILAADGQEGIPDPYGGSLEIYRETRDTLEKAVEALADQLLNTPSSPH